jgi:hypothetical protein
MRSTAHCVHACGSWFECVVTAIHSIAGRLRALDAAWQEVIDPIVIRAALETCLLLLVFIDAHQAVILHYVQEFISRTEI